MSLRDIRDARGVEWRLWDVRPSTGVLRSVTRAGVSRRADAPAGADARQVADTDAGVERFRTGWLAAESADGERRRIAPIPVGWAACSERELLALLARAERLTARRHTRLGPSPSLARDVSADGGHGPPAPGR